MDAVAAVPDFLSGDATSGGGVQIDVNCLRASISSMRLNGLKVMARIAA